MGDVRLTHGVKWQRQLAKAAGRAGDALGRELGCCARVGVSLLLRTRGPAEGEKWRAGPVVGRTGWAEQLAGRPSSPFLFSIFYFFSIV